jgi:hypothetical protein
MSDDRLTELRTKLLLDEEEIIERFMLEFGCSMEDAEEMLLNFKSEFDPANIQ